MDKAERERLLAELRSKHGDDIVPYEVPGHGLLVIAWHDKADAEYSRLTNALTEKTANKAEAMRTFALSFVVYPSIEQALTIFKRLPAFATKVAGRCQQICGSEIEELGKA